MARQIATTTAIFDTVCKRIGSSPTYQRITDAAPVYSDVDCTDKKARLSRFGNVLVTLLSQLSAAGSGGEALILFDGTYPVCRLHVQDNFFASFLHLRDK